MLGATGSLRAPEWMAFLRKDMEQEGLADAARPNLSHPSLAWLLFPKTVSL